MEEIDNFTVKCPNCGVLIAYETTIYVECPYCLTKSNNKELMKNHERKR